VAVWRRIVHPGGEQSVHGLEAISDGHSGVMLAGHVSDRMFAVLVHNHAVRLYEHLSVVLVQGESRVAFVVDEFVRAFVQAPRLVGIKAPPALPEMDLTTLRETAARQVAFQ
jgi:hypothetical protein